MQVTVGLPGDELSLEDRYQQQQDAGLHQQEIFTTNETIRMQVVPSADNMPRVGILAGAVDMRGFPVPRVTEQNLDTTLVHVGKVQMTARQAMAEGQLYVENGRVFDSIRVADAIRAELGNKVQQPAQQQQIPQPRAAEAEHQQVAENVETISEALDMAGIPMAQFLEGAIGDVTDAERSTFERGLDVMVREGFADSRFIAESAVEQTVAHCRQQLVDKMGQHGFDGERLADHLFTTTPKAQLVRVALAYTHHGSSDAWLPLLGEMNARGQLEQFRKQGTNNG